MSGLLNLHGIKSFLSDITCGEACWEAREDVCHCSCGGKNHGIHRRGGTAERTAKIDGYKYKLEAVGKHRDLIQTAGEINGSININGFWDFSYKSFKLVRRSHLDKGAAARVKYATQAQVDKWKELEAFKGEDRYHSDAALLWVLYDIEDFKANAFVYTAEHQKAAEAMNELEHDGRRFVFYRAMMAIGATDTSNQVWRNPDFHLDILDILEMEGRLIAKYKEFAESDFAFSYDQGFADFVERHWPAFCAWLENVFQ